MFSGCWPDIRQPRLRHTDLHERSTSQPLCISNTAHHKLSFLYPANQLHSCNACPGLQAYAGKVQNPITCGTDAPSQSPRVGQASRCCSTLVLLTGKLKSGSTTFNWVPTLVGESSHQHTPVLLCSARSANSALFCSSCPSCSVLQL